MRYSGKIEKVTFYLLILFSFALLLFPIGPVVKTSKAILSYIFIPSIESVDSVTKYIIGLPEKTVLLLKTEDENRRLRKTAKENILLIEQLDLAISENEKLSKLTGFDSFKKWDGIWAKTIGRPVSRWNSVLFIDKGSKDNLKVSDIVLCFYDGGLSLCGKIIEVNKASSKVLLLTDIMSAVHCYIEGGGYDGLLQGNGNEILTLNYIPSSASLKSGSKVFTSSISAVFPANIYVGSVEEVYQHKKHKSYISALVKPAADIGAVKEVYVIKGKARNEDIF